MPSYQRVILAFVILFSAHGFQKLEAQKDTSIVLKDTPAWLVPSPVLNKTRLALFTGTAAAAYTATLVGLNNYWYVDYPKSSFHFFDDRGEWLQIDKCGHTTTAYLEAYYLMHILRWTGVKPKPAAIYAGMTAFMLQNTIEFFDGFSAEWGASWSDIAANFTGAAFMTTQELVWHEQKMRLKVLRHPQSYTPGELQDRADQLFGRASTERILKDYNAMNYWLSINPASFNKNQRHVKWLNVALGYGAGDMYGGYENVWTDEAGVYHDRTDIERYRRFYLSLDVDFSKIKTRSRTLKAFLGLLNIIKVPAPGIEFNTKGEVKFHPLM
jgi:hypothetical protein